MKKAKIINFSTQYKIESNSWSYWDYIWLQKLWLEFTNWDDYDFVIFSLSNIVMAWWELWKASLEWLQELREANLKNKPVIALFLDFKTYTNKLSINNTMRKKYQEIIDLYEFEDYRDNWYLASFTRDLDKFKQWHNSNKNWIKFKDENIFYLNNMSFWYYDIMEPKKWYDICYIWNWRWGERNKFLSNFHNFDIYWRWKDKQINELKHNFKWVIKQTKVKEILNNYWAHIITYDIKPMWFRCDVTRLAYTLSAWCLPLIDKRLTYLDLPKEFDWLYIENQNDIIRILEETSDEQRKETILELQKWIETTFNKYLELNKILKYV